MAEATKMIREFFDAYAKATGSLDLTFLGSAYGDTFLFVGPGGVQAVKRDDFLKVVPKRGAFFKAAGLVASEIRRLEETRLDENHTMVQAQWSLQFEKDPGRPIIDEIAATYVLRRQQGSWQIVFQLDHQDLAKRVQKLGLLPPSG
jgi:ketosteroid isomerase-like protein